MSLVSNATRRIVRMPSLRSKSVAPIASFSSLSAASKSAQSSRSTRYIAAAAFAAMGLSAVAIYSTQSALMDSTETHPSAGLDPKNFLPLKLKSVEPYNYNTKVYHFALPDPNTPLDLPVSSAVVCRYMGEDGKPVIRPYTPIDTHIPGEVILLVKEYEKGIMSKHIANMKVGDTLDIKGPIPKLKYTPNMKKKIGFLVGGTGVTPAMQVINEVLRNPEDKTELYLLFANVSPRDILLKETIDKWAAAHKNFHVTYFIDNHHEDWKGEVGRIDQKAIEKTLPIKACEGNDVLIYACGPPAFYENVSGSKAKDYTQGEVGGALARMGFTKDQVYKF